MRTFIVMLVLAMPAMAADDLPTLRARAALALAFVDAKPPTYAEQYAKAVREGKPLVVWVGQPARPVTGCVGVRWDEFPGVGAEAVVIGVPAGTQLRRVDVPGRPTDAAVRAAIRATESAAIPTAMLPVQ